MLLATSDSEAAKNPRLRLMARRSSSVSPSRDFQSAMSACIVTSVGIQWLLQAARYFSHAHLYFSGRSWLTSARQLIIALSSTETRAAPRAIWPSPVVSGGRTGVLGIRSGTVAAGSDHSSIEVISMVLILTGRLRRSDRR